MKFLADENIHSDIVAWIRSHGHDVLYVAETLRSEVDDILLATARNEGRILITNDKDFGELVFHRRLLTHGVVLMRLSAPSIAVRLERLAEIWTTVERQAEGHFMVIGDRRIRVRTTR